MCVAPWTIENGDLLCHLIFERELAWQPTVSDFDHKNVRESSLVLGENSASPFYERHSTTLLH
jgi:hypothetical protein